MPDHRQLPGMPEVIFAHQRVFVRRRQFSNACAINRGDWRQHMEIDHASETIAFRPCSLLPCLLFPFCFAQFRCLLTKSRNDRFDGEK